jgi:BirA family biotin operon repressor/biotin-[acetyl-CoA-carboxylase] ligase
VKIDNERHLLALLLDRCGTFVAAATLADLLHITPAEVHRHIEALQTRGAVIAYHHDAGYCLQEVPVRLYPDFIHDSLSTVRIARHIYYFPRIDSTNSFAKKLAAEGAADGTVVLAEEQTAGRGRMDRTWLAPVFSSILCSIIFFPKLPPAALFRLTMIASVAIVNAIRRICGVTAHIKWPNDIYLGGKKVCGILTEFSADPQQVLYAVVGIGLNVNNEFSEHPELQSTATSLRLERGKTVSRFALLVALLEELDDQYHILNTGGVEAIRRSWEQHALIRGKRVTIFSGDRTIRGIAQSINDNGHLIVIDTNGACQEIICGDVSLRLDV